MFVGCYTAVNDETGMRNLRLKCVRAINHDEALGKLYSIMMDDLPKSDGWEEHAILVLRRVLP